jgi:hypothetical protein
MQSHSYWAYREAGAFCDEHDPDYPERRNRCTCGAFLPAKPTYEGGPIKRATPIIEWRLPEGADPEDPYDWEEIITGVDEWEDWEDASTDCKRCHRLWTEQELWN